MTLCGNLISCLFAFDRRRKRKKTDFQVESSSVSDQGSTGSHDTGIDLHQDHDIASSHQRKSSSSSQKVTSLEYHRVLEDAICKVAAKGGSNLFSPAAQGGSNKFAPVFQSSGVPYVDADVDEDTAKEVIPVALGSSLIPSGSRRLSIEKTSAWLRHQKTRPFDRLSEGDDDDGDDGRGVCFPRNKQGEDAGVCAESCLSTSDVCSRNDLPRSRVTQIDCAANNKDVKGVGLFHSNAK